jgi:hypothetical protein
MMPVVVEPQNEPNVVVSVSFPSRRSNRVVEDGTNSRGSICGWLIGA